jgi:hypothetical protein
MVGCSAVSDPGTNSSAVVRGQDPTLQACVTCTYDTENECLCGRTTWSCTQCLEVQQHYAHNCPHAKRKRPKSDVHPSTQFTSTNQPVARGTRKCGLCEKPLALYKCKVRRGFRFCNARKCSACTLAADLCPHHLSGAYRQFPNPVPVNEVARTFCKIRDT